MLLSPSEIEEFYESEFSRSAVKLFGLANEGKEFGRSQFCIMRNCLLLRVYLKQGLRTAVCAMLTAKEFENPQFNESTQLTIMEVVEHKNTGSYGDAVIVLSEDLCAYFKICYEIVRPVAMAAATT